VTLELDTHRPPVPPADLILRVGPSFDAAQLDDAKRAFDLDALIHLQRFESALAALGRRFEQFERLLDFRCGCGQFLRHLRPISDRVEIHGTDIDPELIEWVSANIPYASSSVGQTTPTLPYPDEHFDLIVNHSVFTHLDEHHQDLWLSELQRITRPEGLLMLTFDGTASWNRTAAMSEAAGDDVERWRTELESHGILSITEDHFIGSTHPDSYHPTIHAPWYVFEHWTAYFDVVAYFPEGSDTQDLVVLRRRPGEVPAPRPVGRRPPSEVMTSAALGESTSDTAAGELDPAVVNRQLNMLRAGVYEQGRRVSVVAAQLRDEISAASTPPPAPMSLRQASERAIGKAARRGRAMLSARS
jgi:SAM-dependent methyltransferase